MNRHLVLAAAILSLATAACGPVDSVDEQALLDAQAAGPVAKSVAGATPGLQLSAATVVGGSTLLVTVSNRSGAKVYLTFPKTVFAGQRWVTIPSTGSATVALYVSPFLTAPTSATIWASTSNPDPASAYSQVVTAVPSPTLPAVRPQVASAVLSAATVVTGGTSTLDVTLSAPAPEGGAAVQVAITNDFFGLDADVAPVLLVPAGATQASATIRTHLSNTVATTVTESVIANLFGGTFQGGPLVVNAR